MTPEQRSAFVRRFAHRTRRFLPGPTRAPSLVTRLPVRPARFPVGLDEPVQWSHFPDAASAPLTPAFYLGRVEEAGSGDSVLATLWERPSGREMSATLSVNEHFQGRSPPPGSLLRVWTWVELWEGEDGHCQQENRVKVTTELGEPSEQERERLLRVLERLKRGEPGYGNVRAEESPEPEPPRDEDEA